MVPWFGMQTAFLTTCTRAATAGGALDHGRGARRVVLLIPSFSREFSILKRQQMSGIGQCPSIGSCPLALGLAAVEFPFLRLVTGRPVFFFFYPSTGVVSAHGGPVLTSVGTAVVFCFGPPRTERWVDRVTVRAKVSRQHPGIISCRMTSYGIVSCRIKLLCAGMAIGRDH